MKNIDNLFVFYKVGQHLSFSRAAEELKTSKSVVSRRIRELESELGISLISRTTRFVRLSQEGQDFFDRIKNEYSSLEHSINMAKSGDSNVAGKLNITAPVEFSHYLTNNILPSFLKEYPDIQVHLEGSPSKRDLIRDGFDLAIRIGNVEDCNYRYRLIGKAYLRLFSSEKFLNQLENISDLDDVPWVTEAKIPRNGTPPELDILVDGSPVRYALKNIAMTTSGLTVKMNMIKSGLGVGFLPPFIFADAIRSGDIQQVLPNLKMSPVNIGFLFPNGEAPPPRIRVFIEYICAFFKHVKLD